MSQTRPHCSFVLLAEFDILEGAQLKYQFPQPLGVDESVLAMSMLPDGAETQLDDWTVFFLNQTQWNRIEPVVGLEEDGLLCVLNLVRTKHDKTLDRGARVLALAICTRHPFIQIFKPVLLMALDDYLSHPSQDVLARLFDSVNAIDFSAAPVLSRDEKLVMRLSERKDIFVEKHLTIPVTEPDGDTTDVSFGSAVWVGDEDGADEPPPATRQRSSTDASSASSSSHLHLPRMPITRAVQDTHFFNTTVEYNGHKLPIKMPLSTFPEEVGDYSLITLIRVFSQSESTPINPVHPHLHTSGPQTHPIIILFNALLTNKNIIFLGHRRPAGEVSMFVLAACALGSGCGAVLRGFIERAFPYANLNNRDEWEGVPAYIAGVTNPIFEASKSWDLLCDIGTGTITVAKDIWAKWPVGPLPALTSNPNSSSLASTSSLIAPLLTRTGTLKAESDPHDDVGSTALKGADSNREVNSADNAFIEDIKLAIEYHYGESLVRVRFMEYVVRFVRLASRWEEETAPLNPSATNGSEDSTTVGEKEKLDSNWGAKPPRTKIGYPSSPFIPPGPKSTLGYGTLGSGLVFNDDNLGLKELLQNAHRIEGWRDQTGGRGKSYVYCAEDFAVHFRVSPIRFDVLHQIFRLRHAHHYHAGSLSERSSSFSGAGGTGREYSGRYAGGTGMSDAEAHAIFRALADGVRTYEQVVEFLSHLNPHTGFLLPLAFGLFHQNASVREATVELFDTLRGFGVGIIFLQFLNHFQRYAYVRLAHAREARKMLEAQGQGQQGQSFSNYSNAQGQQAYGQGLGGQPQPPYPGASQPPPYPGPSPPPPPVYSNTANVTSSSSSYGTGTGAGSSYGSSTGSVLGMASSYGSGESRLNGSY